MVNSQNSSVTFDNSGFFGFSFSNGSIVPFKEFEHQDTYAKVRKIHLIVLDILNAMKGIS